jgi:predicted transcriptional regulator
MSADLLDLIDNDLRRKILSILSIRPSYTFELARSLGSSQQLIAKHMRLLEESGLVYKVGRIESAEGPPRILYKANAPLLSLLQFMEKISVVSEGTEQTEWDKKSLEELVSQLKLVDMKILELERTLKEMINTKQSIILSIDRLFQDMDISRFYRMIDDALTSGNFDLLFEIIKQQGFANDI